MAATATSRRPTRASTEGQPGKKAAASKRGRHAAPPGTALDAYTIHEAADMFPLMSEDELQSMAADIKANGQQNPIWVHQGVLIDGRNRILACAIAGVDPIIREWQPTTPGATPAKFIVSENLERRNLSPSQRAALAVELAEALTAEAQRLRAEADAAAAASKAGPKSGQKTGDQIAAELFSNAQRPRPVAPAQTPGTSVELVSGDPTAAAATGQPSTSGRIRDRAAKQLKVSSGYVNDATALRKDDPDRFAQVKTGQLSLNKARDEVVAEAKSAGTLDQLNLRPGAIREALERLDRENAPKRKEPAARIRLPKASRVSSSATALALTVTFGNPKIAEEYLNKLQDDPRCLDLDFLVLEHRPTKKAIRMTTEKTAQKATQKATQKTAKKTAKKTTSRARRG